MKLLDKIFRPRINDKSDKQRLAVVRTERALREGYNYNLLDNVIDAREYLFNEAIQLRKVENKEEEHSDGRTLE